MGRARFTTGKILVIVAIAGCLAGFNNMCGPESANQIGDGVGGSPLMLNGVCVKANDSCDCRPGPTNGVECNTGYKGGSVCCAHDGYPDAGSCDCNKGIVTCLTAHDGSCTCDISTKTGKQTCPDNASICCNWGFACTCYYDGRTTCEAVDAGPVLGVQTFCAAAPESGCRGVALSACSLGTTSSTTSTGTMGTTGTMGK